MFLYFVVVVSIIVIAILIKANIYYHRDLKKLTPEEKARYKREEADDLQIW